MGLFRKLLGGDPSNDVLGNHALSRAAKLTSEGNYYGERGDFDRAIECFRKALSAKADHVPAHLSLATAYREKGEYQRALDVLASAPSEATAGEPIDMSFEIAFHKVSVLLAKHQCTGFRGDTRDLLVALEQARDIGARPAPATDSQRVVEQALGVDLEAERREKLAAIDTLIAEMTNEQRS